MQLTYLDYNATTPVDQQVLATMMPFFAERFANPSSQYASAKETRKAVEESRIKIAGLLNAKDGDIIFTGGGTEANNLAIKGVAFANRDRGKHIIVSQIEHQAVLKPCKYLKNFGFKITYVPVGDDGIVDIKALRKAIKRDTILISVMYANNVTGVIQPIEEIARLARKYGVYFHTDAVQAVGKIPVDIDNLGVDLLTISGHKIYGPKGVGALYIRKGVKIDSVIHGGGQEMKLRAGTENVPGIVGLAKALEISVQNMAEVQKRVKKLRDTLEDGLLASIPDCYVTGDRQRRLFNTSNLIIKYVEGEALLMHLNLAGICASSGSACSSGTPEPSHVMLAMGVPPEFARGSLRFSLGRFTTEEDIQHVIEVLPEIVRKLRRLSPVNSFKN